MDHTPLRLISGIDLRRSGSKRNTQFRDRTFNRCRRSVVRILATRSASNMAWKCVTGAFAPDSHVSAEAAIFFHMRVLATRPSGAGRPWGPAFARS